MDEIERTGWEPGAPRVALHDHDIREPLIGCDGSRLRDVLGIEIQSGHVPGRADPLGEQLERAAWPAPEVERVPPHFDPDVIEQRQGVWPQLIRLPARPSLLSRVGANRIHRSARLLGDRSR